MVKSSKKEEVLKKKKVNRVIFSNETKKSIKIIAWVMSFLATTLCILTFVFSIIASLNVINTEKTELLNNNFTVTFISNINSISFEEAKNLIQGYGSKALFVIYDIVIPSLAFIAITILLIILLKKLMDFVNSSTKENDLYTTKKLHEIEKMACITEAIITISFVVFKRPSILLYLFVSLLLFIIIGLFKKCVEDKDSQ